MKRQRLKFHLNPKSTILLIDGKHLAYRVRYSSNNSLSYKDYRTGIVYGFFNTLQSLGKKFLPHNTLIFWDIDSKNCVRFNQFSEYKKKRYTKELTPEEKEQKILFKNEYLNLIKLCDELGLASYSIDGYEADDAIALYCQQFPGQKVIVSKDEDFFQLFSDSVSMYNVDKKFKSDLNWFRKTYGIEPEDWIQVKALGGCKSDCVPGIKGIGEKTAIDYIQGNAKDRINKLIKDNEKIISRNLKLVELPHMSLVNHNLRYKKTNLDIDEFINVCQIYGFRSFLERLGDFEIFMR
jgi:5'-3' exonuclease